ncbi:hypothetical protein ACQPWW_09015 [Micromonospora sp. CA-240977]|uniref:biotin synthase auxiliary protein BsaP n=1 Tax=Micromonospora sp. CA-240977 TaxID=3239957 RepID=UPI003D8A60E4
MEDAGQGAFCHAVTTMTTTEVWCDRCGEPATAAAHPGCASARQLEPPRFCQRCRRRMKVQVLPVGWSAVCVEHGEIRG